MLNPNRIVHPPRFDDRSLFRYAPGYAAVSDFKPKLDWSDFPGPLGGMLSAVEMCNNNGTCRSFDAGVMCPSYRATRDEQHLTRGRANTLRLALSGQLGPEAMASDQVHDAMALCVSCKACRRECPTGVDMAKMKIEAQAARVERHGVGLRERLIAEMPRYAALASTFAPLANLRNNSPMLRRLTRRVVGFAEERSLPAFRRDRFLDREVEALAARDASHGEVMLFVDTFNRYFEPENARAALRVIAASGYKAVPLRHGGRPICCGRTYLSAGMVDKARAEAQSDSRRFGWRCSGHRPRTVLPADASRRIPFARAGPGGQGAGGPGNVDGRVARQAEYTARISNRRRSPRTFMAIATRKVSAPSDGALAALGMIPDMKVIPISSSCCGMAGAFGYQAETQQVSRAMAEASLMPAVRKAGAADLIVADGTSCRHQIADLSDRKATHSVRVLADRLRAPTART